MVQEVKSREFYRYIVGFWDSYMFFGRDGRSVMEKITDSNGTNRICYLIWVCTAVPQHSQSGGI
jgi:hypothetical protein